MNTSTSSILAVNEYKRRRNLKTALCFGHFSAIHPGHIKYFEYASKRAEKLIVLVKGDHFMQEVGSKNNGFTELERANSVASINTVDQVLIQGHVEIAEAIRIIKPDVFVLGREFEKTKPPELAQAAKSVEYYGGVVEYHGADTWFSIKELEQDFDELERDNRKKQFTAACKNQNITMKDLSNLIEQFEKTSLLVIGDTIVDKYVACEAIGMSAEAPVIVLKELEERKYLGGAAIVASHVKSLGANCKFISVTGDDDVSEFASKELKKNHINTDMVIDCSRPTTYKTRFTVEHQKLCRVSRLNDSSVSEEIEGKIIRKIRRSASQVDGIIISDFGYGCVTDAVLSAVLDVSKKYKLLLFGDVQCSSQIGNVLKFENFDMICPTEKEARVSLANKDDNVEAIANKVLLATSCRNLLMKLGSNGFIIYTNEAESTERQHFPALNINPIDVAGAGDSLLASLAVSMCSRGSAMQSAALGTCVASIAVSTYGNTPVNVEQVKQRLRSFE